MSKYNFDWIGRNGYLNTAETKINAVNVRQTLQGEGWTLAAISALCGNMEAESGINPGRKEDTEAIYGTPWTEDDGFGLTQWTPATKLFSWIRETFGSSDYGNGNLQMERIMWEARTPGAQWISTAAFPLSFEEFSRSLQTPEYLAAAFLVNYERAYDTGPDAQAYRGRLARKWYDFFGGVEPPDPPRPPFDKLPVWLLFKFGRM